MFTRKLAWRGRLLNSQNFHLWPAQAIQKKQNIKNNAWAVSWWLFRIVSHSSPLPLFYISHSSLCHLGTCVVLLAGSTTSTPVLCLSSTSPHSSSISTACSPSLHADTPTCSTPTTWKSQTTQRGGPQGFCLSQAPAWDSLSSYEALPGQQQLPGFGMTLRFDPVSALKLSRIMSAPNSPCQFPWSKFYYGTYHISVTLKHIFKWCFPSLRFWVCTSWR